MNLPQFQLVVPAPDNPYFAGLAAQCKDEKILSIDYLPAGCFEKAKAEAADPQKQKVVGELKSELEAYFKDPKSANFGGLKLCYSMLPQNGTKLPLIECIQALKKMRTISCVCAYKEVGEKVEWNDKEAVKSAYSDINSPFAKAVADVCTINPLSVVIPCYRIIKADGTLGGFGGNKHVDYNTALEIKRWLLKHEGCEVNPPDKPSDEADLSKWKVHCKPS